jgi:hypothetical protein
MTALNECEGKTPSQKTQVLHPSHTSSFLSTYHHLPRPFVRILTISNFLHTLYIIRRIYNHLIAKRIALVKDEFKSKEQETVVLLNPISNLRVLFMPSLAFACLQQILNLSIPRPIMRSYSNPHEQPPLSSYLLNTPRVHMHPYPRLCTSLYVFVHPRTSLVRLTSSSLFNLAYTCSHIYVSACLPTFFTYICDHTHGRPR